MNDNSPNIKFTPSKDGNYRAVGTNKPTGAPSAAKDFKRIYQKTDSQDGSQAASDAVDEDLEAQTAQRTAPRSLFDLQTAPKEETAEAAQPQFPNLPVKNKPVAKAPMPYVPMPQSGKNLEQAQPKEMTASLDSQTEVAMTEQTFVLPETAEEAPPQAKKMGVDQNVVATQPRSIIDQAAEAAPKNTVVISQDAEKTFNIYAKEETPKAYGTEKPTVASKSGQSSKTNASSDGSATVAGFDKMLQNQGALAETDADGSQGQAEYLTEVNPKGETKPEAKVAVPPAKPAVVETLVKEPPAPTKTVSAETGATMVATVKPTAGQEKVEVKEGSKPDLASKRTYLHTEFNREQPDLSYVNPFTVAAAAPAVNISQEVKVERPIPITAELQILIDKLATEMTVVQQSGQTETTVELKYPPLFEGARITLTSFETAKNEFNIRFENLTQAAQHVLGQEVYRQDLLANLEHKGYNVHIFTATTYDEARTITANIDNPNKGRDEQESRERQQGGKQQQREKQK